MHTGPLMDSFTVTFGSHVKHTQNLRISNSELSSFFHQLELNDDAKKAILAQNNAILYTKKLNALVLIHQTVDFETLQQRQPFKGERVVHYLQLKLILNARIFEGLLRNA